MYVRGPDQQMRGTTMQQATSVFSGVFATIYLLCEVLFKLIATILPRMYEGRQDAVVLAYTLIAVTASISMSVIDPLDSPPTDGDADNVEAPPVAEREGRDPAGAAAAGVARMPAFSGKNLCAAAALLVNDRKVLMLSAFNFAYGFASIYLTSYLNGTVVKNAKGWEMIGYYSAITPVVAGLIGLPLGYLGKRYTKKPVMLIGSASFILMLLPAAGPLKLSLETISQTPVLVAIYALEGTARCVFEGANRGVFADFFPQDSEAAFANVVWQSGGASTIAFLLLSFPVLDASITAFAALICAFCSIPGFLAAAKMHERETAAHDDQEE
jgi:hypothetical protein